MTTLKYTQKDSAKWYYCTNISNLTVEPVEDGIVVEIEDDESIYSRKITGQAYLMENGQTVETLHKLSKKPELYVTK